MIVAFQLTSVRSLLLLLKTLHNAFVISEVCNRSLCVIPFKTEVAKSQETPPPPAFFLLKSYGGPLLALFLFTPVIFKRLLRRLPAMRFN